MLDVKGQRKAGHEKKGPLWIWTTQKRWLFPNFIWMSYQYLSIGLSRTLCMLRFKGVYFKMPRDTSSTWPEGSHRARIPMNVTSHHQDINAALMPSGAPHPPPTPGPTQHPHKSVDPTSGLSGTCWICGSIWSPCVENVDKVQDRIFTMKSPQDPSSTASHQPPHSSIATTYYQGELYLKGAGPTLRVVGCCSF